MITPTYHAGQEVRLSEDGAKRTSADESLAPFADTPEGLRALRGTVLHVGPAVLVEWRGEPLTRVLYAWPDEYLEVVT